MLSFKNPHVTQFVPTSSSTWLKTVTTMPIKTTFATMTIFQAHWEGKRKFRTRERIHSFRQPLAYLLVHHNHQELRGAWEMQSPNGHVCIQLKFKDSLTKRYKRKCMLGYKQKHLPWEIFFGHSSIQVNSPPHTFLQSSSPEFILQRSIHPVPTSSSKVKISDLGVRR